MEVSLRCSLQSDFPTFPLCTTWYEPVATKGELVSNGELVSHWKNCLGIIALLATCPQQGYFSGLALFCHVFLVLSGNTRIQSGLLLRLYVLI